MIRTPATLGLLVSMLATPAVAGNFAFQSRASAILPSDSPSSVLTADFNADGLDDFAVASSGALGGSSEVAVQLGDGSGSMTEGETFSTDGNTYSIAAGDFNSDGNLDIVVLGDQWPFVLASLHLGDGTGAFGFSANTLIVLPSSVHSGHAIVAGDFDEDGALDFAVAGGLGLNQWMEIYLGDGAGAFSFALRGDPWSTFGLTVGDLNGDGHLDLLTPLDLWLGAGDGTFTTSHWNGSANRMSLVDLDGDGDLDLLSAGFSNRVETRFNDGTGQFFGPVINLPWNTADARAADLDHDGVQDLIVVGSNAAHTVRQVAVLRGLAGGGYAPEELHDVGFDPRLLTLGDWDADGSLDLAIPDRAGGGTPFASVLLSRPASPVGTLFCDGAGSASLCPCGNAGAPGHGCAHSHAAAGCFLRATGTPSVATDSLQLQISGARPNQPGVFFQGDALHAGGSGLPFGDGLLCAAGHIRRLGVAFADGDGFVSSNIALAAVGAVSAGSTLNYQFWFRDPQTSLCQSGFNFSNALAIVWAP